MMKKIVLAYARKYEPQHLVDELLENMAWVDAAVCLDQRSRTNELWSRSDHRVAEMREMARATKCPLCIIMAPDERLQDGAEAIIRGAIEAHTNGLGFSFHLREMWTPTKYRDDGVWGNRRRRRITHLATGPYAGRIDLDCEILHLKMIEPENRAERARVHTAANTWDNRTTGFAYMNDETGLTLRDARPFNPPYRPYRFEVPAHLL